MMFEITQITQASVHFFFKSFARVKSIEIEKGRFILRNELKLTQVELLSFSHFKSVISLRSWHALIRHLEITHL